MDESSTGLGSEDVKRHKTDLDLVSESLHFCESMDKLIRNKPQCKCSDRGMRTGHCGSTSEISIRHSIRRLTNYFITNQRPDV